MTGQDNWQPDRTRPTKQITHITPLRKTLAENRVRYDSRVLALSGIVRYSTGPESIIIQIFSSKSKNAIDCKK
jgi:hypothetical protein